MWPDVRKMDEFSPKVAKAVFTLNVTLFKIAQKDFKHLDCFCNKIVQQALSNISQSGHTVMATDLIQAWSKLALEALAEDSPNTR